MSSLPAILKIKTVHPEDVGALQCIGRTTFSETFASANTEADMALYLSESLSTAQLKNELENADSRFYFAVQEEQVIGYLKLNLGAGTDRTKG